MTMTKEQSYVLIAIALGVVGAIYLVNKSSAPAGQTNLLPTGLTSGGGTAAGTLGANAGIAMGNFAVNTNQGFWNTVFNYFSPAVSPDNVIVLNPNVSQDAIDAANAD
jgi:hypothetical protein